MKNIDEQTVKGFGEEWATYDQSDVSIEELQNIFDSYFQIFPWRDLPDRAVGFDAGCGSGRWAKFVVQKVGHLHCVDAGSTALAVAQQNLENQANCTFYCASVEEMPIPDESMDFGYSLGVLHHIPDTLAGLRACVRKLKPGAPFLVYLYYSFDNRPIWFKATWKISDILRRIISRMPFRMRRLITEILALCIYWPLARIAKLCELCGMKITHFPLSGYRDKSFYTMRTDSFDRFGTAVEKRFSKSQIREMMTRAGLNRITFSEKPPFWCAVGYRGMIP